ncbi:MAG: hypothetical protein PWR29_830 [Methanolobus sp.]|jgi:CRISPR-associated protein (TIGR02710 family)|nr:hypothetical protein [Methanolobus sp.]MDN5310570.1 hypothetical protein [Methanolobus sp.]
MNDVFNVIRGRVKNKADLDNVLEELKLFQDSSDTGVLRDVSSRLFPYEKRYIEHYKGDCDVLICTVGMRESPIILSLLAVMPKTAVLLHTEGSLKTIERIVTDQSVIESGMKLEMVMIDEVDAAKNYRILKEDVLPRTLNRRVRIDPTGGRKIMGTAVGAFAFFFRIPMIYLHAEEKMGVSVPFSGSIRDIDNPFEYFGDIDMKMLKDNFDHGYFGAAFEVCEKLSETVHDAALFTKIGLIRELTEVYSDWDGFVHSRYYKSKKERESSTYLAKRLESIVSRCDRLGFKLLNSKDAERNISFLKALEDNWECRSNITDRFRLIDVYMNANRRAEQGLFDDATARMYRCFEICATLLLEKEGISNLSRIDYESFAQRHDMDVLSIKKRFKELSGFDEPRSPPGLNDQMVLLQIINNPAGKIYAGMNESADKGESIRDKRNRSILAHGTSPISKEDYLSFERETTKIVIVTLGNATFKTLCEQATFPKLMV